MKTTTFKELVAQQLLTVLEDTTAPQRKVSVAKPKIRVTKFPHDKLQVLYNEMRGDISENYIRAILQIIGVAFEDEDLVKYAKEGIKAESSRVRATFPIYSVIILTFNTSSHSYPLNTPIIYLHTNGYCLNPDGRTDKSTMRDEKLDTIKIATKEQVIQCVSTLTDAQWKTILSNDLFLSIREKAMNIEVTVVESKK